MDLPTFIVRVIEALVWPGVILAVLWVGRSRVIKLLERLENFEGWGAKVKFGQHLDRVEKTIGHEGGRRDINPSSSDEQTHSASDTKRQLESLIDPDLETARVAPAYLVERSYRTLRHAMRQVVESRGAKVEPGTPTLTLAKRANLPDEDLPALRELRTLRNEVAHNPNIRISPSDALRYRDIAKRLTNIIEDLTSVVR